MAAIKIKFGIYCRNNGDGSCSFLFYKDEATAQRASNRDMEEGGENFDEDVDSKTLEIDTVTGEIVGGLTELGPVNSEPEPEPGESNTWDL